MTDHQPFAQSVHERVQVQATIERVEGGSVGMGTPAVLADRMTRRAHSFGKSPAVPVQATRLVLLGETERCSEQQKHSCEPYDHCEHPHARRSWNPRKIAAAAANGFAKDQFG
jgi:hypothetical protein